MSHLEQKIISFSEHKSDIAEVNLTLKEGWTIVRLIPNKGNFIGFLEKITDIEEDSVYIPPRKGIIVS